MAGIAYSRPVDGNGLPLSGPYDPTSHQNVMPQAGPSQTDSNNNALYAPQYYAPVDGQKATYATFVKDLAVAASATDIFTLTPGGGAKVLRVTRLRISGTQTTGGDVDVQLIKRSTVDTAGTKTNPTIVPYDSSDAAATGVVAAYTANPTLGTAIGTLTEDSLFVAVSTAATGILTHDFGNRPAKAIVLRGTEQLAVSLAGVTVTGGALDLWIEWTEE